MIFTHKLFSKLTDLDPNEFFVMSPDRSRGHKYKVLRGKATKLCRINNFANRVITEWNALPEDVVTTPSTDAFKAKLDKLWHERIYKTPF